MMLVLRCKGFTAKEKRKILLFARTLFYLGRRKKNIRLPSRDAAYDYV